MLELWEICRCWRLAEIKCCFLTCCDLDAYPCLYFQVGIGFGLFWDYRVGWEDFRQSSHRSEPEQRAEVSHLTCLPASSVNSDNPNGPGAEDQELRFGRGNLTLGVLLEAQQHQELSRLDGICPLAWPSP